eukprot:scaffold858_cov123-Cylindrotheca_fusiformis.AAC.3
MRKTKGYQEEDYWGSWECLILSSTSTQTTAFHGLSFQGTGDANKPANVASKSERNRTQCFSGSQCKQSLRCLRNEPKLLGVTEKDANKRMLILEMMALQ